jgi:cell division inhibitor SepF
MVEDNMDVGLEKQTFAAKKEAKGEVNIFPALTDRRGAPISALRQAPTRVGTQISIFSPVSFEEALDIVECLRGRAATTISLENMKKVDANRLVDFVAGASAALNGDFHKLSDQVYLFCPSNIKITAPSKQAAPKYTGTFDNVGSLDFLYPLTQAGAGTEPTSATSWS